MNKPEEYTQSELDNTINEWIEEQQVIPQKNPTAYLLGGQPGAGKSSITKHIQEKDSSFQVIDADSFRNLHPRYAALKQAYGTKYVEATAKWIAEMTEKVIDKLSDMNANLIIEGTLRTADTPIKTAAHLQKRGYDTKLAVMAVKDNVSYTATLTRYFKDKEVGTGRAVNKDHHDQVVKNIPENLDKVADSGLFSSIHLYNRNGEIFVTYDANKKKLRAALQKETERPLTPTERKKLKQDLATLKTKLELEIQAGEKNLVGVPIRDIQKALSDIKKNLSDRTRE